MSSSISTTLIDPFSSLSSPQCTPNADILSGKSNAKKARWNGPRDYVRAEETWKHFRRAQGKERIYGKSGHAVRYCLLCEWQTMICINAREHLKKMHNIIITVPETLPKDEKAAPKKKPILRKRKRAHRTKALPQDEEARPQDEGARSKDDRARPLLPKVDSVELERAKENVLQRAVKQEKLNIALVKLITACNLPHNAVSWPELQRLLMTVNHTVEPMLDESCRTVPQLLRGDIMEIVPEEKKSRPRFKEARPVLPIFDNIEQENKALRRAKEKVLKRAVRQDALNTALAMLIAGRNLPHDAAEWGELQELLVVVNYTVKPNLIKSVSAVPKLIRDIIKEAPAYGRFGKYRLMEYETGAKTRTLMFVPH